MATEQNLLPKCNSDYATKEYWNWRYEHEENYEWFKTYQDLKPVLSKYIKKRHKVLVVGCGNSELSANLYDDHEGMEIVNIDYSEIVIQKMTTKNQRQRPLMTWVVMDVTEMTFSDETFDVVIDKGTLDAILSPQKDPWKLEPDLAQKASRMLWQVSRVLKRGGLFFYITFGQPHFRKPLLLKECYNWVLDIQRLGDDFHYFVYILKKCDTVANDK
jgi:ubiquinone/menaquinone biosynthesis C-methylase UbiE